VRVEQPCTIASAIVGTYDCVRPNGPRTVWWGGRFGFVTVMAVYGQIRGIGPPGDDGPVRPNNEGSIPTKGWSYARKVRIGPHCRGNVEPIQPLPSEPNAEHYYCYAYKERRPKPHRETEASQRWTSQVPHHLSAIRGGRGDRDKQVVEPKLERG